MPKIIRNGIEYTSGSSKASGVVYDNTNSSLEATNVQGAIDEVNNNLKTTPIDLDMTITSGVIDSIDAYKSGNVVFISLNVHNTSAISVGSDIVVGKFNNYLPVGHARGSGIFSASTQGFYVNSNGAFGVRQFITSLNANDIATASITYITNE